jgi:outer membrane protein assembly factor BamB
LRAGFAKYIVPKKNARAVAMQFDKLMLRIHFSMISNSFIRVSSVFHPWPMFIAIFIFACGFATAADSCFESFDPKKSLTQIEDLHQWFEVIAGQPQGILETRTRLGKCGAIEGLVRLNRPWTQDMALRFALDDYNRLQIHLFRGEQGVTLVYHEDDLQRWAGYITTRKPRGVTPVSWQMSATDDWRNRRTFPKNHDQYELRCLGDEVVLSRGDIGLLRVPFSGQPEEVYFQGKAAFHGLSAIRSGDYRATFGPDRKPAPRNIVPAVVSWTQPSDDEGQAEKQTDGSMRLPLAARSRKRSWMATPIPRDTLNEIVLDVVNASPGSGIYFGNGKDGPKHVLRYVVDRRSRQLCLMARHDDDADQHDFRGLNEFPLPTVTARHWLRLVFGAGQLRWWISPDGVRWSEPAEPIRNLALDVTHFGLHCANRREGSSITLKRISMSELTGIAKLANSELQRQAIARKEPSSIGDWLANVTKQVPAEMDANDWRRACALRTLASGCNRALGNELLLVLANDDATREWPPAEQLRMLDDVALLLEIWDDNALLQRFAKRYQEVGRLAVERDQAGPFSFIRQASMTTPIATRHPFDVASEELLRTELIQLVYGQQWPRIIELGQILRFFQLQQKAPLLDFASSMAVRNLPVTDIAGTSLEKQKEDWRELFVEDVNKDVYNFLAQLRVELDGPNRDDAARTIASIDNGRIVGLAPHWHDKQLFVSLPIAIRCAMRDELLRSTLAAKYADMAALRAQQAMSRFDTDTIALICNQFATTEAAVKSHLWLADHAMAVGQFAEAVQHYRQAEQYAAPPLREHIRGKLMLANALAGEVAAISEPGSLKIGDSSLTHTELEKLAQELAKKVQAASTHIDKATGRDAARRPVPANYNVHRHARLDGPVGNDPNREFVRDVNRRQLNWVDRQLGIRMDGNRMLVCNRFQVAAYDLQSKQRVWQTAPPPGQIQFAQESTFTAAQPLVTQKHIFIRLLYGPGGTLACLDPANGQYRWTVTTEQNEEIVSDPFFLGGRLCSFLLVRQDQQENMLRFATYDQMTGFVEREQDVIPLRDTWRRRRYCELVTIPGGVIVALGGVVANIDSAGRVLWLRKQISLPPDEEPQWAAQNFQPPIVAGDRLHVFQPGVRTLDSLKLDTGELVWSRLFIDLERVIGTDDGKLICQRRDAMFAIDAADGKTLWSQPVEGLTGSVTVGKDGDILCVQRPPGPASDKLLRPRLAWFDSDQGTHRATFELKDLEDTDPRFGPLLVDHDRIWTFWGRGNDPTRDVIELSP